MFLNQAKSALHQCAAFVIRKLAQSNPGYPQVIVFVGIAPGTTKRALTSKFDGKRRDPAGQNICPRMQYFGNFQGFSRWLLLCRRVLWQFDST